MKRMPVSLPSVVKNETKAKNRPGARNYAREITIPAVYQSKTKRKEVPVMSFLRKVVLCIIGMVVLASPAFAASEEPLYLRLNWEPGDTFKYRCAVNGIGGPPGQSASVGATFGLVLRVLESVSAGETDSVAQVISGPAGNRQALAFGGRLLSVELQIEDMGLFLSDNGHRVEFTIDAGSVRASVNGTPVRGVDLDQLRKDARPAQEMLNQPIRLLMTGSGRVVKVSGLENMDADTQRETAMGFIEQLFLPDRPMRVGDQYKERRSLELLFPKPAGQGRHPMAGQTVELVRTLRSIKKDESGKMMAEFITPMKKTFPRVPILENGTWGSYEMDMLFTRLIDAERGHMVRETAKGKVVLRPEGEGANAQITLNIEATTELIGLSNAKLTPAVLRRNEQ
jgi:hypothetical protein